MSTSMRFGMMGLLGAFGVLALVLAARAQDTGMYVHAWMLFAGMLLGLFWLARDTFGGHEEKREADDGYYMDVVRAGTIAAVFWAIAGFSVGVFVASELAWPWLNFGEYGNFGRLRPVHTTLVIFGFGGNALIATSLYVVQRTNKARLPFGNLRWFVFWGYQLFLLLAISGYVLGV